MSAAICHDRKTVHQYAKRAGKKIDGISEQSLDLLRAYPWPGNIRALQNVIERAVIVSDTNTLSIDDRWLVRQPVVEQGARAPLDEELTAHERSQVEAALAASKGRVSGPTGRQRKCPRVGDRPRHFGQCRWVMRRSARPRIRVRQAVGTVPPSITYSVPVMEPARGDATNAMRSATSRGLAGRPSGMPPSDRMMICLPPS